MHHLLRRRYVIASVAAAVALMGAGSITAAFAAPPRPSGPPGPAAPPIPVGAWVVAPSGTPTHATSTSCSSPSENTIQAAVSDASKGQTVYVCAGTYTGPLQVSRSLTLEGVTPSVRGPKCASSMTPAPSDTIIDASGADGVELYASGITFEGFWVQGNTSGPGAQTLSSYSGYHVNSDVFYNNVFGLYFNSGGSAPSTAQSDCFANNNNNNSKSGSASGDGIYEDQGLTNGMIARDSFANNLSSAVVLINASNVGVDNNASIADGSLLASISSTGGSVDDNTVSGDSGSAVYLCGANGLAIDDNSVINSGSGIYADGSGDGCSPSSNVDVANNVIRGTTDGIYATSGSLSGSNIVDNQVQNSSADGIYMDAGTNTLDHNHVTGSRTDDCYDGTTGQNTAGTANSWLDNQGTTSSPAGLCSAAPQGPPGPPPGH